MPREPESLKEASLTETELESLILKFLLAHGEGSGHEIADQVKLPFVLVNQLLGDLKNQQLLAHRGSAPLNDFIYLLTDVGRERARRYSQHGTYFGSAPVSLKDYIESVHAQSLTQQHPSVDDLHRAFADLLLNKTMLDRLGPAINSGRGLFLFGPPGNGKTSIAERVTAAFGQEIWVPRALGIGGVILRVYDPTCHEELPLPANSGLIDSRKVDRRWIRIRRPTIIAGGELTMSQLEITVNPVTGICEAPLQMKSNCGTLVIDDFGRQRIRIDELLNRWIVPLEKRVDFLNLPNGKKIKVPFDQLIIFSTNLEPRDLVDEAFLRRIPYKIEVADPVEAEFRRLFEILAPDFGLKYHAPAIDYLIDKYYRQTGRPFRFCQPRDLLLQVRNYCRYFHRSPALTEEYFDRAAEIYFAIM
ncbi:MAG: AAA family ATPase [Pirellulales bacterium]|nr:AAA family ATPase [Pirellulales bacterium]